ncbi:MAG TPA: DUF1667 domain-containing protein [Clostridia bacterium]|nr:DUF1667 domain-containing protein [Clostridia bacterium]
MKKDMVCVACPLGCNITVTVEDGDIKSITGNTCKRGEAYAINELTNPTRSLTTTVRVKGGVGPVVSVKSNGNIPKKFLLDSAKALRDVEVEAPVDIGDVVLADVFGTGVDIVATNFCKARQE